MAKERKTRKLRGCMVGCAAVVFAGVALTVTLVGMTFVGYGRAIDARDKLDRLYPTQAAFTPASDGRIDTERMRRFLAVRHALVPQCESVTESQATFTRMARHSGDAPEPDAGIGLGEYTWIYVIVYFAHIGERPVGIMGKPVDSGIYATRVFDEVEAMIRRHVEEAGQVADEEPDRLGPWRSELDALAADPGRIPFEDGLPTELTQSIAAFRSQLEAVSCVAANELDAVLTERRGLKYEHF